MDREGFLDTLRNQVAEEIQSAYVECEHQGGQVDFETLTKKMKKLMAASALEGLPRKDFEDLMRSTLPAHAAKIDLGTPGAREKKAA